MRNVSKGLMIVGLSAVVSVGATGCRDTGTLVPAVYQSAELSCDCTGSTGLPLRATFLITAQAYGKEYYVETPGGCVRKKMDASDDGKTYEQCFTAAGALNRVDAVSANALQIVADKCLEPQLLPKCVAVMPSATGVVSAGPLSFQQKCEQYCATPSFFSDVTYCDMKEFDSTGACLATRDTGLLRTTAACRATGNATVSVTAKSCAPISDLDPVSAIVRLDSSARVTISALDEKGAVIEAVTSPVTGFLAFDEELCASGSCPLNLLRVSLNVGDFTLRGEGVRDVALGRDEGLSGTLSSTGTIILPGTSQPIAIRASLARDGVAREGVAPLSAAMVGTLDPETGELSLRLTMVSAQLGARIDGVLTGVVENRTPKPRFELAETTECGTSGGALVAVDASATTDADGEADIRRYEWYVDGLPAGDGKSDTLFVPMGSHEIMLRVVDTANNAAHLSRTTFVVDTVPPTIAGFLYSGPACLWPPNHEYVVLDVARDFSALVTDACDPSPTFTLSGAESNQPEDSEGDGNSTEDVALHPDHVCLRAERAGNVLAGRTYTLNLIARDASGNTADPEVTVRVPHDQADAECAGKVAVVEGAPDGAGRCAQPSLLPDAWQANHEEPEATPATSTEEPPVGCASAPGGAILFAGAVIRTLRSRRRDT